MHSAIGRGIEQQYCKQNWSLGIAVFAVGLDMLLIHGNYVYDRYRLSLALVAFAALVYLNEGNLKSLGLQGRPIQGWSIWVKTSLKIGVIITICIGLGWGLWYRMGYEIPFHFFEPQHFFLLLPGSCIEAPLQEETIYRFVVCVSLNSLIGERKTIAVSGILFGLLHIIYGNPSPENLLGGLFLAWAFLKSETILIPLILHSVGNLLVLLSHSIAWYLLLWF
ncbi:type II CAAX endopeptidase family protein [Gimesia sp.]|uniref:CPBP family intramembrane glutamic endopeptidase n=1 Tax=Gimesia sp. TaxID=2024833 RepID=UPI0032EC818C